MIHICIYNMSKLEPCQIISGSAPVIYVYVCSEIDYASSENMYASRPTIEKNMQVPKTFFEIEKKIMQVF